MTDQTSETTETDVEQDATATPATDATETEPTAEEGRKGNPEAAKWRTKFRDAEAQVAALSQRVTDLQRAEIVRQATGAGLLIDGDDVFRDRQLADLLDDDGNVDADLVAEAVAAVRESKPHLGKPYLDGDVGIGTKAASKPLSWADVIGG